MPLTDTRIKNATPLSKTYKLSDGERLTLVVKPNGSKLWQFRYEFGGKAKVLSIGRYPDVSLSKARELKTDAKKSLRKNIDPSTKKQQERKLASFNANNTFELLAREWHERKSIRWSAKYAENTLRRLEIHAFPLIGKRPVEEILPMEILEIALKLEKKGKTDMSHRVLEILNSVFRRAVITGRLERNPAEHLSSELLSHSVTHHPALAEEDLPEFLNKLQSLPFRDESTRLAVWLLLLTAVRQCELRFSKKSDIDLARKEWVLRPEVTKMKREHIVPLSTQALTVIERLFEETPDSEWLVPSRRTKKKPVMSENTINKVLERMGYKGRVVGHGFRSIFSTVLNDHGFDSKIVDRQLAHVGRDKIEAAYNRAEYNEKREQIMHWWGDHLDAQLPSCKKLIKPYAHGATASQVNEFSIYRNELQNLDFHVWNIEFYERSAPVVQLNPMS